MADHGYEVNGRTIGCVVLRLLSHSRKQPDQMRSTFLDDSLGMPVCVTARRFGGTLIGTSQTACGTSFEFCRGNGRTTVCVTLHCWCTRAKLADHVTTSSCHISFGVPGCAAARRCGGALVRTSQTAWGMFVDLFGANGRMTVCALLRLPWHSRMRTGQTSWSTVDTICGALRSIFGTGGDCLKSILSAEFGNGLAELGTMRYEDLEIYDGTFTSAAIVFIEQGENYYSQP